MGGVRMERGSPSSSPSSSSASSSTTTNTTRTPGLRILPLERKVDAAAQASAAVVRQGGMKPAAARGRVGV